MPKSIVRLLSLIAFLGITAPAAHAQPASLNIYWVDVEGGAATLIVSPSGESLLIDAGWEVGDRDAKRIYAAARRAGLTQIDYFILSHFHGDHAGGLPALAKLIPIARCFDRGDFIEPANQKWRDGYLSVCGSKRTIVKAGYRIPLKGLQIDVVASDGRLITQPVLSNGGGQPNPLCATAENRPKDVPENQLMVGALVTYGKFTFLDLADLDWEKEMELACPINRLGRITIWQAGRHGALDGAGAPGFLHAVQPQVVIVNNGPRKGLGSPSRGFETPRTAHYERIAGTPGIEGIWQGHLSLLDRDHNTAENMIANLEDTADCQGHFIQASVRQDGTFTVTNSRNGFSRTYTARGSAVAAQTPAEARPDTAFHAVSYVEVMAAASSKASAALKQYRDASRARDGFVRFDIFEQIGRPGHFAIVERWRDQPAFDARGTTAHTQLMDVLAPIRVSNYDQRPYKTLTVGPAPATAGGRAVSVVSHVDVNQDPKVPAMLRRLAEVSRRSQAISGSTSCST